MCLYISVCVGLFMCLGAFKCNGKLVRLQSVKPPTENCPLISADPFNWSETNGICFCNIGGIFSA